MVERIDQFDFPNENDDWMFADDEDGDLEENEEDQEDE